jgi:hypothetical protein
MWKFIVNFLFPLAIVAAIIIALSLFPSLARYIAIREM